MKAPLLSVDKVEFLKIQIEANPDFAGDFSTELYKIKFNFKGSRFFRKVQLGYAESEAADPRNFGFSLNLILEQDKQPSEVTLPYQVDIEAIAYMKYRSDTHQGEERFRAVRATAYTILYGAIREMVSNLTARGPHGMWVLPAADFNQASKEEAVRDEEERLSKLSIPHELEHEVEEKPKSKPKQRSGTAKRRAKGNAEESEG